MPYCDKFYFNQLMVKNKKKIRTKSTDNVTRPSPFDIIPSSWWDKQQAVSYCCFRLTLIFWDSRSVPYKHFVIAASSLSRALDKYPATRERFGKRVMHSLLRLLKNLSGTDISQSGSRVLHRPGSSLGSID